MEIFIVGLGLIGGSLAKALKQNTSHRVLGMDVNDDVLLDACSCGAIDGKAATSFATTSQSEASEEPLIRQEATTSHRARCRSWRKRILASASGSLTP